VEAQTEHELGQAAHPKTTEDAVELVLFAEETV